MVGVAAHVDGVFYYIASHIGIIFVLLQTDFKSIALCCSVASSVSLYCGRPPAGSRRATTASDYSPFSVLGERGLKGFNVCKAYGSGNKHQSVKEKGRRIYAIPIPFVLHIRY
jgi:hypothetical protein